MSLWNSLVNAFHQTNHDTVNVASRIGAGIASVSKATSVVRGASEEGVFASAVIEGGAGAAVRIGAGVIGAAAPEIAGAAIGGAAVGYVADFVDHFGQNMGWWKN